MLSRLAVSLGLLAAFGCATERHALVGGGEALVRRSGDRVFVRVRGEKAGFASLCMGDQGRVEILHASAALGTAVYGREGSRWRLENGFTFTVRDSPKTGPPTEAEKRAHLEKQGWLANPSHTGAPQRDYEIRLDERRRFLGVAFLTIDQPMTVSYWPPSMDPACRAMRLLQGYTDETMDFRPETWLPLR